MVGKGNEFFRSKVNGSKEKLKIESQIVMNSIILCEVDEIYLVYCINHPRITHSPTVQWSSRADFSNVVGEREVSEWTSFQGTMGSSCRIADLTQGRRYFFRASCGNVKGWGGYRGSSPSSVIPSSKCIQSINKQH